MVTFYLQVMAWRIQHDGTWFTYRNHSDKKTKRLEEARKAAIWYVYKLSYLNMVILPPGYMLLGGIYDIRGR